MANSPSIHLTFAAPALACRDGLSAVVHLGDSLWLANDETTHLERLSLQGEAADGSPLYAAHTRFVLQDYLKLPLAADEAGNEVDVEGLAYDNGYLWVIGSHSLKRKKPKSDQSSDNGIERLTALGIDPNRYLLARIPLAVVDGMSTLQTPAAQLPIHKKGNALTDALRDDPHLGAFFAIPGKDNGFDIEGLAVAGKRVFIGLRGPVLRGWAVILEVEVVEDHDDASTLKLVKIGEEKRPYRKHFLQLDGLGVRDLCVQGTDLLILAGPTMSLEAAVKVYRWQGGAKPDGECLVPREALSVVVDIPHGQGDDHPEGMCLFTAPASNETALLVVYDSAAASRKRGDDGVLADVFALTATSSPPE